MLRPTLLLLLLAAAGRCAAAAAPQQQRPHIIISLIDDLGWHNVGWRNPEARTPALDSLRAAGVAFERAYVYRYCSPTRSALLSGRFAHHVNQYNWDATSGHHAVIGGGIDERFDLLPARLRTAGYRTHLAGKWHAGWGSAGQIPVARGFETSLGYLSGEQDHWTHTDPGACGKSENAAFHFHSRRSVLKTMILPRQARNKHRKS